MKSRILVLILACLVVLPAYGQRRGDRDRSRNRRMASDTRGFSIGVHLNGTSWQRESFNDDDEWEGGGGLGLTLGYGFSKLFTLYVNADGATIDPDAGKDYTLAHGEIGGLFHFGSTRSKFRPYLDVALTGRTAEYEVGPLDVEVSGGALTFGGGVKYFASRALALDLGLKLSGGELTQTSAGNLERDIEEDAASSRLNFGIVWHPGR